MKTYIWHKKDAELTHPDTIHHILAYGTIDDIIQVQKKLGNNFVKDVFIKNPKNIYSKKSLNFIKKFMLHINQEINDEKYLKSTLRNIK